MTKNGKLFNAKPAGEKRQSVLNAIIEAGKEGVYIGDVAKSLSMAIGGVTSCLQPEDMIYEETSRGRTKLFWCGGAV
jgi:hypothetical protein